MAHSINVRFPDERDPEPDLYESNLMFALHHFDNIFNMNGTLNNGVIRGDWSDNKERKGTWSASIKDYDKQILHSPLLAPLFRFDNPRTGAYYYSTDTEPGNVGYNKTGGPICRVWKYPSNQAYFEPAEPVRMY